MTRAAVRAEPAEAPPGEPAAPEAPAATPPEIEPVPPPAGSPSAADEAPGEATRRTFQSYLAASLASFTGLVVGLPVVGYLAAPLTQTIRAAWISLGRADTFRAEEPRIVAVSVDRVDGWRRSSEARTVWVRALGAGRFKAFNGQCTHLGCAFSWKTQGEHAGKFFCPCHDGVYDAEGKVLAGPPPRELDTLETRVENGELLVLYQDFQQGISEKKPL
ncbi:MAG TPA: ubiquinol-cytochrome c reductase iron-sulfur subunit [Chloroflexota bacterium]|nr:ubiquinol-cytochrome c reductase iron-sulfur subunit [Chloroflexota bacterium]